VYQNTLQVQIPPILFPGCQRKCRKSRSRHTSSTKTKCFTLSFG
jgi:hypothetical protein